MILKNKLSFINMIRRRVKQNRYYCTNRGYMNKIPLLLIVIFNQKEEK